MTIFRLPRGSMRALLWAGMALATVSAGVRAGEPARVAQAAVAYRLMHSFTGADGRDPGALLALGSDGKLHGTANYEGGNRQGTAFRMTPGGQFTVLQDFGEPVGKQPNGQIQGNDGDYYGTTQSGGRYGAGTVYRMSPSGKMKVLHAFRDNGRDCRYPTGLLTQAIDGNFYGAASGGGRYALGCVFKMSPEGSLTVLHSFQDDGVDGQNPSNGLIQASDGNFYGTTASGGSSRFYGTVFRLSSDGTLTVLHSFDGIDGSSPGPVAQGPDGQFYGVTTGGGAHGRGTVYRMSPIGEMAVMHDFADDGVDGLEPGGSLLLARDGDFYGVTHGGGHRGTGTVYRITLGGVLSVLFDDFLPGPAGGRTALPQEGLVEVGDGEFYGTTYLGGDHDKGTIFRIRVN